MAQNFLSCDREQDFLLAPSVREWLPAGHLAWWLVEVVGELDLHAFYAGYRADGSGRPAHDPEMMVALMVYAYCVGERSSRRIERRCVEGVAFRVIAANRVPDHTTIARFRQRFAEPLAGLFVQVLAMCAKAGMVRVGTVAVDGTKMAANAGLGANRSYAAIRAEVRAYVGRGRRRRRGRNGAVRHRARGRTAGRARRSPRAARAARSGPARAGGRAGAARGRLCA